MPNLTLTVTPYSTTSRFLISANITFGMSTNTTVAFRFMRGTTPIGVGVGGPYQGSFRGFQGGTPWATNACGEFLDSPATTSAVTYSLQFLPYNATFTIIFNNSFSSATTTVDGTVCQSTLTTTQC